MPKPKFLILSGDGINCEQETCFALNLANAQTELIHINQLIQSPNILDEVQGLAFPGGFSFGDELGSGQILALKIKHGLKNKLEKFISNNGAIIGICNGFQVLLKLGLLPSLNKERTTALTFNESGKFINTWSPLKIEKNTVCKWTHLINDRELSLPVRHGEGRIVFKKDQELSIYNELQKKGQVAIKYRKNINGSYENIAGICDESGLVFGLMPHPEAYIFEATARTKKQNYLDKANGQLFFDSIVNYLKNS